MMKHKLPIALVLVGIYLFGGITGAIIGAGWVQARISRRIQTRLLAPGEAPDVIALTSALEVKLHLNGEQRTKVAQVLRQHQPEIAALMRAIEPQAQAIRERQWGEIRPLLDPSQQQALDELIQEQLKRRKRFLNPP